MRRLYTPEQHEWISEQFPKLSNEDLAEAFTERFGQPMDAKRMKSYGSNHGLRKLPETRSRAILAGRGLDKYTEEWREWFKSFAPFHPWPEVATESLERFGVRMTKETVSNWRASLGVRSQIPNSGCFRAGHVPANKGRTWEEMGWSAESKAASLATTFKKGNEPCNAKGIPIGTERVGKDGYLQVKTTRFSKRPGANTCWRMKHHIAWEEANGRPVPPHTMIVFADGDKRNFDSENLVAVPRAIWAVISRRKIPFKDRETLEAAMAIARLKSATYAARTRERECGACGSMFKPRQPRQRTCDACLELGLRSPRKRGR